MEGSAASPGRKSSIREVRRPTKQRIAPAASQVLREFGKLVIR
jgi:hypothetical protein